MSRNGVRARYITSVKAYLLFSIPLITAVPATRNEAGELNYVPWLVASLAGYGAIGIALLVLRFGLLARQQDSRLNVLHVAAIGAVVGLIKGVTTGWVATLLGVGLGGTSEILVRSVPASIMGMVIITAVGVIVTNVVDFRDDWRHFVDLRTAALEQQHSEQHDLQQSAAALEFLISQNLGSVLQQCQQALSAVQSRPVETQWSTVSTLLRTAATEHVKPLSQELWLHQPVKPPTVGQVLQLAATRAQVPVLIPAVMAGIAFIPSRAGQVTLTALLIELAVYMLVTSGGLALSRVATETMKLNRLASLISSGLAAGLCMLVAVQITGSTNSLGRTLINIVWITSLTVGVGIARSLVKQKDQLFHTLKIETQQAEIEAAALRQANRRMYRQVGQYLHSTVQSRLMASALILESHTRQDSPWFLEQIDETIKLLMSPLSEFRQSTETDISAALSELATRWEGIVSIQSEVSVVREVSASTVSSIVNVIQEAISNASRHGLAQHVLVQVCESVHRLHIDVRDDGIGPRLGPRGLGSSFFDEVGQWSLRPQESGQGSHFHMSLQA